MGVTLEAWLLALQALLPPGRALVREPGAVLTRLLESFAALLLSAQLLLEDLAVQYDPRRALSMLPDWERLLGLPDACAPAGQQVPDRQVAAFGRLTEFGGQSRAYFIDLAQRNGEAGVTITDGASFAPMNCNSNCNSALFSIADRFVWRVNIPHPALNARTMTCNSACDSALQMYTPSTIECMFNERKPAHTSVIFAYAP